MGADFNTRWFFAGAADVAKVRTAVVERVLEALRQAGFQRAKDEEDATRSLVIGPAGRWLFTGDSAAEDYDALSRDLSTIGPVVDVKMSDDAVVHFYLYRRGSRVDQFGSGKFPCYRFETAEEAAPWRGRPELWSDLLLDPRTIRELRSVWEQGRDANTILTETGRLLGWQPQLMRVGFTSDDEGIPTKYDEYLQHFGVQLEGFTEFFFKVG